MRKLAVPLLTAIALLLLSLPANAQTGTCDQISQFLNGKALDVVCFDSPDLTTNNTTAPPTGPTTLPNNYFTSLPAFAFTPVTDRGVIAPAPPLQTSITHAVPGIQVEGRFADDPTGQARFLLRFPYDWNGKLVVAGASGTRSEFNGDFAWSDFVLQKGYAYASQNKGVLNFHLTSADDPMVCRLNPSVPFTTLPIHYYDIDPAKPFTQWTQYMIEAAQLSRDAVKTFYNHYPRRMYAVGTSNGGYQVRRVMEAAPQLFDGAIDWEGTFIDPNGPNLLIDLPPVIKNYPDYVASGYDASSQAAQNIMAAGYPPDIVLTSATGAKTSLWGTYYNAFWETTMCQWQKRFDPTYDTYGAGPGNYNYVERVQEDPAIATELGQVATTGKIQRPVITLAGTMDALLPIKRNARPYEANVLRWYDNGKPEEADGLHGRKIPYRLYEVQNGNHIETYKTTFSELELIMPYAHQAFDLLVDHVENNAVLPESQCIPHNGSISATPAEPGHCANLYIP